MFTYKEIVKALISTMWDSRPLIFKKEFWIDDFPSQYHPACFKCNKTICINDCPYIN